MIANCLIPDPEDPTIYWFGDSETAELDSRSLFGVHSRKECVTPCTIHMPSQHHMRSWPLRYDGGLFRVCGHARLHADPDSYYRRPCKDCCGCCARP